MSEPEYDCGDMEKVQIYDSLRAEIARLKAREKELMEALLEARRCDWTRANAIIAKRITAP